MKELNMLVWITQLGLSVALPLGGFTLLGLWLRNEFGLGAWVVLCGCLLGLLFAISGLRQTLRMMEQMDKNNSRKKDPPPVSFNEHD